MARRQRDVPENVLEPGRKVYWTYRYRIGGSDREMSVGVFPAMSLADARINHAELRAMVLKGVDPVGDRRKAKARKPESRRRLVRRGRRHLCRAQGQTRRTGKNRKHRQQWRTRWISLPEWFRDLPVAEIKPEQVRDALKPIWTRTPETGSRLRGRIAAVIEGPRASDDERRNPASWTLWMKTQLGSAKKLGKLDRKSRERVKRGNHAACPTPRSRGSWRGSATLPATRPRRCCSRLDGMQERRGLGAIWDEFDLDHVEMMGARTGAPDIAIPLCAISGQDEGVQAAPGAIVRPRPWRS